MRRIRKQSGGLFPRRLVRIAKPDVDLQAARQLRVTGHPLPGSGLPANHERVGSAVAGHALAQGSRFIWRVKLPRTASAPLPFIWHETTKRVLRSTSVPADARLKAPLIRSPYQCPGTIRASISSGRLIMRSVSGTMDVPASVVRLRLRAGLACRSLDHCRLKTAARLGADRGMDGLVAHTGRGVTLVHAPQSLRNLRRRPAPMNEMVVNKAMKRTALDQPAQASAARPVLVKRAPRCHGAAGPIHLPPARQFPAVVLAGRSRMLPIIADCCHEHARPKSRHVPRC